MSTSRCFRCLLITISAVLAAGAKAGATPAKPAPLDISATASLGYDSNVYLVDEGPLGRVDSAVSTLGVKIGTSFAGGVTIGYSATGSKYWNADTENNMKHVLTTAVDQQHGALTVRGTSESAQVQGQNIGKSYGVASKSTFATSAPRERRDQLQNKSDLSVRLDTPLGFVRGVGKLQYWDMQTRPVAGTENYRDRYDLNAGVDLGRTLGKKGPDCYLGYRLGYLYQDTDGSPSIPANSTNRYDRYLVGLEGKIAPAFKLSAQAGWSVHDYNADYLGRHHIEGIYTDITATWTPCPADQIQLKTSQGRTMSSTAKQSLLSTQYQTSWKHDFNLRWSTNLTGKISQINYDGSGSPTTDRDDQLYTGSAALTWKSSANLAWTLSATYDTARNLNNHLSARADDQAAFNHALISLGLNWKI